MPHADRSLQGLCNVPQGLAAFTLGINWNGLRPSAADFEFSLPFLQQHFAESPISTSSDVFFLGVSGGYCPALCFFAILTPLGILIGQTAEGSTAILGSTPNIFIQSMRVGNVAQFLGVLGVSLYSNAWGFFTIYDSSCFTQDFCIIQTLEMKPREALDNQCLPFDERDTTSIIV